MCLKENNKNIIGLNIDAAQVPESIGNMLLNVKLLETMAVAGNLYGKYGEDAVMDLTMKMVTIEEEGITKKIRTYTLQYIDGRMENKIDRDKALGYIKGTLPGFTTYIHKVHLFSFSSNSFMIGMKKLIEDILKSIGANISGTATTINYGTAAVSMAMASPIFAPISAPVGIICTLLSTSAGFADAMRSDAEMEYSKLLAAKAIGQCINMSYLGSCVGLYTVYACYEMVQPEDRMDAWNTYEQNYEGKTDTEARREGYATQDTISADGNEAREVLGQGCSYSISIIDSVSTIQRLKNFNDNMKHIRISGENGVGDPLPPKTISEGEGMEEFKEIKDLEELIDYMHKITKYGEYYLYALALVGLDGSDLDGKIVYLDDNGKERIINEYGVLYFGNLFQKN